MNLEDPITKYVKELNSSKWGDVTLGLLASQLAGILRDVNAFDYGLMEAELLPLGFPALDPSGVLICGSPSQRPCSRSEFFKILLANDPVWEVGDKAAYSDIAYIPLGYALENATGLLYVDIIKERIAYPLGLNNTGFTPPKLSKAILPIGTQWFEMDIGNYKSTAGLYTTPSDLSRFLRSILGSTLLPPARVRQWLKPVVFTSSHYNSVGAPWEIFRPVHLTPAPRPIDHYTKQGNLLGYAARVIILPEYNVATTLIGAGDGEVPYTAVTALSHIVQNQLVPALETAARAQAMGTYGGRYISKDPTNQASLTLVIDNGPGLKISNWTNLGKDMLRSFENLLYGALPDNGTSLDARIYPIGSANRWRVAFEMPKDGPSDPTFESASCGTWYKVDQFRYVGLPLDEFDFRMAGGRVRSVEFVGLRTELVKI